MEFVEEAVQAFLQENELEAENSEFGNHVLHRTPPFRIFQGDVFDLKEGDIQADAWYDRAAMIAIPRESRIAYVDQLRNLTKPDAVGLLITFAYPQEEMDGPPFSLSDDDVRQLFSDGFVVECLEQIDLGDEKERGLSQVTSSVFQIKRI